MAARPRTRGKKDLPQNLYESGGYYKYKHPQTGKYHGLGLNRAEAIRAANVLNNRLQTGADLIAKVIGGLLFTDVIDRYENEYLPRKTQTARTTKEREYRLGRLRSAFGAKSFEAVQLKNVADFLAELQPQSYIKHRQELIEIYRFAVSVGLCERNLAEATLVHVPQKKARKRWTPEGYQATFDAAEPWLQNAMTLAALTLQRREDLVNMKHEDAQSGRLLVRQRKTRNYAEPMNLAIQIWPELLDCINRAKLLAPFCPYIIGRKPERDIRGQKTHPYQVTADYLSKAVAAARDASGYFDGVPLAERPTLHELRAFGAHLYRENGKPDDWVQALLGHSTAKMTKHYLSGHAEAWIEIA